MNRVPREVPPDIPDLDLIRCIGQGGFGRVWLAVNRATGQLRAVKLIPLQRTGTTDPAGREIASIARLEENPRTRHPNLLNIDHVGKTADHLFYIMDAADDVSGAAASSNPTYRPATLRSRLADAAPTPEECLDWTGQLLGGLASLHAAGMVHRDVKPANCLFVSDRLKLADFGLLTEADPAVSRLGTVKYMPPDGRMDATADVYAAGLVIYEMLTGLPADSFPRLGNRAVEIADDATLALLNRLALRASQADPSRRFRDAREMLDWLEAARRQGIPRRKPVARRVALLALLATLATATVIGLRSNGPGSVTDSHGGESKRVDVNFIADPHEATIFLDGRQQFRPNGEPHTTPCTIDDLPARPHRVEFKFAEREDVDFGEVDFSRFKEVDFNAEQR